jgi:tetrahydromethanopterin S-methyltransferase subunit G
MTEEFASEILEHLVPMRAHLDGLVSSLCDVDRRLEIVDGQLAILVANQAGQTNELKRINGRLNRIEMRLELNESPSLI